MIIRADARQLPLRDGCVQCVVTSPPYWGLRNYGYEQQIGLEATTDGYVEALVAVFDELRRVLREDGTVWLNLGDSYGGGRNGAPGPQSDLKHRGRLRGWVPPQAAGGFRNKDLVGIPWRVAFALQADGWYLRSDIIWAKPNQMPESVTDRPTKSHEYLFLLTKSERYTYDASAIAEPVSAAMLQEVEQGYEGLGLKDYEAAGVQNPSSVKARIIAGARRKNEQSGDRRKVGFNDRWDEKERRRINGEDLSVVLSVADPMESAEGRVVDQGVQLDDHHRKADAVNNGRSQQLTNPESERRDQIGTFNNNPRLRPKVTRNRRTVWIIPTMPYAGAHFATMPEALVEPCILAGCPLGGLVLDPFLGSGTVGAVAERLGRRWVGTDLSYQALAVKRTAQRGIRFD